MVKRMMDRKTVVELGNRKLNLPLEDYWGEYAGWFAVEQEYVGNRRWGATFRVVMRDSPAGQHWAAEYTVADEGAEGSYEDEESELVEVFPDERTITVYVPRRKS